jgi:tetratricopeptide (TPR) repeat protein
LKKRSKIFSIIVLVVILVISVPVAAYGYSAYSYNKQYNLAEKYKENDNYDDALLVLNKILPLAKNQQKKQAIEQEVKIIEDLKQSKISYDEAMDIFNEKRYLEAIEAFKKVTEIDEKRYSDAQEKIAESKKLYSDGNIESAKTEAADKKYESAIKFLDNALGIDSENSEANKLKEEYNTAIKSIKEEEEKKAQEEKKTKEESARNAVEKSEESQVTAANGSSEDIVAANNGFFFIKDKKGNLKATFGLGPGTGLGLDPIGIYYNVYGNNLDFEVTFYLNGRVATQKGKTSESIFLMPASFAEVPKREKLKITVTIIYNGKKYTDTFWQVLNTLNL